MDKNVSHKHNTNIHTACYYITPWVLLKSLKDLYFAKLCSHYQYTHDVHLLLEPNQISEHKYLPWKQMDLFNLINDGGRGVLKDIKLYFKPILDILWLCFYVIKHN